MFRAGESAYQCLTCGVDPTCIRVLIMSSIGTDYIFHWNTLYLPLELIMSSILVV